MTSPLARTEFDYPAIWLRDNCFCTACKDPLNQQKRFDITDIADGLAVADVEYSDGDVTFTFQPDGHRSVYPLTWLDAQRRSDRRQARHEDDKLLWSGSTLEANHQHEYWSDYLNNPTARLDVLQGIQSFGFAVLHGTPTLERTVLSIAQTFGFVRATNYGELFDVRVEATPNNLAFTGAAISPHTDNPYRDPVPTMQLLHCLSNDVVGGESVLVDGFHAAAILRGEHPRLFGTLAHTPVNFAWHDAHNYLDAHSPMIELDPLGRVRGIRFNNRSLQPLRGGAQEVVDYYDAYRAFARIIERPELTLRFRLESGDCLIFDNTRILHARSAFEETSRGRRHLQGCYADLDGLASTVSVLALALAADRNDA